MKECWLIDKRGMALHEDSLPKSGNHQVKFIIGNETNINEISVGEFDAYAYGGIYCADKHAVICGCCGEWIDLMDIVAIKIFHEWVDVSDTIAGED